MTRDFRQEAAKGLERWAPVVVVAGLFLFHAVNNWIWLSKNAMTRGWDRINALVNSLYYHQTLSRLSWHALFKASIQDEVRPPLFAASMALMYKFFGVSTDVAVMVNVVYLALLVAASYGIGARLGGRRLGLLGAFLVSFSPLVFSMSRYSYFEFALTSLVVLSVYLLLASRRFESRRNSLLLGLVLGLGTLLKRTFPVFVLGAVLLVVVQAGLPRRFLAWIRARPRPRWRDVALALGGGLLLSALWYLPNRDLAQSLPAGAWVWPIWGGLAAATIYFLLQPSGVGTNFLACGGLAASLASLWYVPHSNFIQRALRAGWGVDDPRGRTVSLFSPATYTQYLSSLQFGISPLYALLLLLLAALLLVYLIRRRPRLNLSSLLNSNWWLILVSVAVPYFILSTSIYKEDRAITPILPFLALILAGLLVRVPWRPLRLGLISLVVSFGLVQFFAVSYTEAHGLVNQAVFDVPLLGRVRPFAQGSYIEVPDSGLNDPGFYIAGDVLPRVEATRQQAGWETISLGVMAGSSHVHVGMFAYDQILHYPAIQIENPVQAHPADSAYSMAFRYDYVAVLEQRNRGEAMRNAVNLILNERRPFFEQAFALETTYDLPDGDHVYLFRRRFRPVDSPDLYDAAQYLTTETSADDLLLVTPPGLSDGLLESYWGPAPIVAAGDGESLAREMASLPQPPARIFWLSTADAGAGSVVPALDTGKWILAEEVPLGTLQLSIWEAAGP